MKLKKILSLVLSVALVVSAAAFAGAESAETPAGETMTADDSAAATPVYTLDAMLTAAMQDAYTRQAAYAAYAQAFPDSRSITGISVDSQIVLLEMLLKANDVALPAQGVDVTVPETQADAYTAIAEAESGAVTMLQSYLQQETLPEDARMIFRSVLSGSHQNASTFARKARTAQRTAEWTQLLNSDTTQKYVIQGKPGRGNGSWTVYVVTNDPTLVPADAELVETPAESTDTTDTTNTTEETVTTQTPGN